MRKWIAWGRLLSLVCALLIMSCASAFAAAGTDWESSVIEVEGTGAAPANARNAVQARMKARRAAVVDAYRQIAEQIAGVQVDAATTVEDMAVSSDVIKTNVSALVQGARIVDEVSSHTVTREPEIAMDGNAEFADTLMKKFESVIR